jgi:hypothetical protein
MASNIVPNYIQIEAGDGTEFVVDTTNGLAYASKRATARMIGVDESTVRRDLTCGGLPVVNAPIPTAKGVQGADLISAAVVLRLATKRNPELALKMGEAGANLYMLGLAGYKMGLNIPASQIDLQTAKDVVKRFADERRQVRLYQKQLSSKGLEEVTNEIKAELAKELEIFTSGQEYSIKDSIVNRVNKWCLKNADRLFCYFSVKFMPENVDRHDCPRNTPIANVNKLLKAIGIKPERTRQVGSKTNRIYLYQAAMAQQ